MGVDTSSDAQYQAAEDMVMNIDGSDDEVDAGGSRRSRPFLMGMTSWPYAATWEAVGRTQQLVQQHGDLYAIWLDNGLPWQAASADGPYPQAVLNKLSELNAEFPETHQRYVSVGLLDLTRSDLATDWDGAERTGSFETLTFSDPLVLQAYSNWLELIIESLSPNWLNFAIEFSDLAHLSPESWSDGAELLCSLYTRLKTNHPDLQVFFSVALKHPNSDEARSIATALTAVETCTDYAAASTYGYIFYGHPDSGNPDNLPENWLSQIQDLIPNKPVLIAETAWLAEDLNIDIWNISVTSSSAFQRRYVELLLAEANTLDAVLVTWWCAVDFDALWQNVLNSDPLASIWRDTGFYDENVNARPSLEVWSEWLDLPHMPVAP